MNTFSVDWLRWTELNPAAAEQVVLQFDNVSIGERCEGRGSYSDGVIILIAGKHAGKIEWSKDHPEFKASITLSGLDLITWQSAGNLESLVEWIVRSKAKVTRLDLAVDVVDDPRASVGELARQWRKGVKTRARTGAVIESVTDGTPGETVYIGSRKSDKFLRIYNKAAEMGQARDWVRLELECKGKYAMSLLNTAAREMEALKDKAEVMEVLAQIARGEIDRYVEFEGKWWSEALDRSREIVVSVERTREKSEHWAWTTLLSMVRSAARDYEGWREAALRQLNEGAEGEGQ